MTEQQAMQMALKALENIEWPSIRTQNAITALRQVLEQQPADEPVDDWSDWRSMVVVNLMRHGNIDKDFGRRLAYYFQDKSPQRKPLSFEQAEDCFPDGAIFAEQDGWLRVSAQTLHDIVRNVEAAHGIKENK